MNIKQQVSFQNDTAAVNEQWSKSDFDKLWQLLNISIYFLQVTIQSSL